jgi:L-seryl-tRNA(Ser) seleniumtransferase
MRRQELAGLVDQTGRIPVTEATRSVLEGLRQEINAGHLDSSGLDLALPDLARSVERELRESTAFSLRPVINATGVILHTNLGRAPLAKSAAARMVAVAEGYSNLELDLRTGARGKRDAHVDRLFRRLLQERAPVDHGPWVGSTSTIVVNNNAAAVWLALNTLAAGGEVIVSRGELVEIGGSFRIPDVMAQSNGILREVGTTNRTRIGDYEQAIHEKTQLLLRVHRSNFQITGFTEQPTLEELVALARARKIPLVEDLGSGAVFDLASVGIRGESGVAESLRAGVDVVTYSGDKLLGGPQAGVLTGRADLISRMRSNSLFRALRVDKLTYAALEATLLAYLKGDHDGIPTLRMMRLSKASIDTRAQAIITRLGSSPRVGVEVVDGESVVGGGAAPSAVLPTRLITITMQGLSANELLVQLRASEPPVIGRVEQDQVVLDLRTVYPEQDELVVSAIHALSTGPGSSRMLHPPTAT